MLTLLYPENDRNAADVAIRVQALAAGEGQKIQVILKKTDNKKKQTQIKKTTTAILIAYDQLALDQDTAQFIDKLLEQNCKIFCFLPKGFAGVKSNDPLLNLYPYQKGEFKNLVDTIHNFVGKIQINSENVNQQSKLDKETKLLIAGALTIAGIITLIFLNKNNE